MSAGLQQQSQPWEGVFSARAPRSLERGPGLFSKGREARPCARSRELLRVVTFPQRNPGPGRRARAPLEGTGRLREGTIIQLSGDGPS